VESFGTFDPSTGLPEVGNLTSDGSVYNIHKGTRHSGDPLQGLSYYTQVWSIRQNHRTSGSVNTANHFEAWKNAGVQLNTFSYQIVATAGWETSGSSSITVS
jgi:endo-1,4-beta-xylanase